MGTLIDGATILVTGASSGIGREFARQLGPRAKALILVARRRERLEELRAELLASTPALEVHVEACDLADRAAVAALVEAVNAKVGGVDVLVNNAGIGGDLGVFDRAPAERLPALVELNVTSLLLLTRGFVPGMVARGRGGILNVSSGFGLAFLPGLAPYIGTKHFVTGFTEALRADLAGTGVVVSQICPGPVATEFESHLGNFTGRKAPALVEISPVRCAAAGIAALDRGRAMVIPGLLMKAILGVAQWSPRWMARLFAAALGRLLRKKQLAVAASG
jgi:short-subunit dehydrogenase